MNLYLMRHGIATEGFEWEGPDETRPLTDAGKVRTRAVLEALKNAKGLEIDAVWSSPLVRAWQTAEIAADILSLPAIQECAALACGASVEELSEFFASTRPPDRVMLVGHEPDMGHICSILSSAGHVSFKKAAVAHLKGEFEKGRMDRAWYLRPGDLLKD